MKYTKSYSRTKEYVHMPTFDGIRFYCGVNEHNWNGRAVDPGKFACISPVYGSSERTTRANGVSVPEETVVIQDSGAFSDGPSRRVTFGRALERQIEHSVKYQYDSGVSHRASYDLLIDEKWRDGQRSKERWTEKESWVAVGETISSAEYIKKNYSEPVVLSAQGVSPGQYLSCSAEVADLVDIDEDIFGLGGWCVSGLRPSVMRPVFNDTMNLVIPFLGSVGIKRVHIWGVADVTFLGPLLWLCDRHGILLSTDSSGPQRRPSMGSWGYRGWYKKYPKYRRAPIETRGIHRMILVKLFRQRLRTLRDSEFYHAPHAHLP